MNNSESKTKVNLLAFQELNPIKAYDFRYFVRHAIIPLLFLSGAASIKAEEVAEETKVRCAEAKCTLPRCLPKWEGHLTLDLKAGNYRKIAQPIIFMPLFQNETSLLFLDLRGMIDTTRALEGNAALAYRSITGNWIFGGYGFFDRRRTQFGNLFNQLTFGMEALNPLWEARFNAYIPLSSRKIIPFLTNIDTQSKASGYSRIITTTNSMFYDTPLGGFDAEVGYEFFKDFRLLLGGYHFTGKGVPNINGARLRFTYDVIEHQGVKFALQGETQYDSQRKGIHYLGFRLTFPIGESRNIHQSSKFTAIEKMMTRDIVRDVDIIARRKKEIKSEVVRNTAFITIVDDTGGEIGDGTFENPHRYLRLDYNETSALQDVAELYRNDGDGDIALVKGASVASYHPIANIPTVGLIPPAPAGGGGAGHAAAPAPVGGGGGGHAAPVGGGGAGHAAAPAPVGGGGGGHAAPVGGGGAGHAAPAGGAGPVHHKPLAHIQKKMVNIGGHWVPTSTPQHMVKDADGHWVSAP